MITRAPRARTVVPTVALAIAGLALALPGAAHAATAHERDAVDHRLPAASDLTGLRVRNGAHRLEFDLSLRSLSATSTTAYAELRPVAELHSSFFTVGVAATGRGHRVVFKNRTAHTNPVCRGLRVGLDARRDVVHVSVPRSCLAGLTSSVAVYGRTQNLGDLADADRTRLVTATQG